MNGEGFAYFHWRCNRFPNCTQWYLCGICNTTWKIAPR